MAVPASTIKFVEAEIKKLSDIYLTKTVANEVYAKKKDLEDYAPKTSFTIVEADYTELEQWRQQTAVPQLRALQEKVEAIQTTFAEAEQLAEYVKAEQLAEYVKKSEIEDVVRKPGVPLAEYVKKSEIEDVVRKPDIPEMVHGIFPKGLVGGSVDVQEKISALESDFGNLGGRVQQVVAQVEQISQNVQEEHAKMSAENAETISDHAAWLPEMQAWQETMSRAGVQEEMLDNLGKVVNGLTEKVKALQSSGPKPGPVTHSMATPAGSPGKRAREEESLGGNVGELSELDLKTVIQLRQLCKERGLKQIGNKEELVARILEQQQTRPERSKPDELPSSAHGSWAQGPVRDESQGSGKGSADTFKDADRHKNVYERKMFDKRVCKLSGEKTEKGAQEFRSWLFDVRKVTAEDPPFHEFLDWVTDLEGEVTGPIVAQKAKASPGWPLV